MRPSVKVGGGAIGAMPMSLPIGSSSVSRVPFLPLPLGIGFPAQFRLVPREGIAVAGDGGQAGRKRVLRKLPPMPTPGYPARSWACCAGRVNLTPNPAVNRTPICVTSSARGGAGAGYLIVRHWPMTSKVNVPFFGGCACGAIRYECLAPPLRMVNCHCRDCQRASGSGYSATVIMAASSVRLLRGQCKEHRIEAESGKLRKARILRRLWNSIICVESGAAGLCRREGVEPGRPKLVCAGG